jgi:hypothetical protein
MTKPKSDAVEETKRLMGALVRMKPKPHEEMTVGKRAAKKRRVKKSAKPNG